MLVDRVAVDLDELLEDGGTTAGALDGEPGRVVEVAVDRPGVLVVRVLRAEHGRAHRAGEVLDVKLHVCERAKEQEGVSESATGTRDERDDKGRARRTERRDVAPSQRLPALVAQEAESAKVIGLAQRDLPPAAVGRVDREELGGDDLAAVLRERQNRRQRKHSFEVCARRRPSAQKGERGDAPGSGSSRGGTRCRALARTGPSWARRTWRRSREGLARSSCSSSPRARSRPCCSPPSCPSSASRSPRSVARRTRCARARAGRASATTTRPGATAGA